MAEQPKITEYSTKEDVTCMWRKYKAKKGRDDYETFLKKLKRFEYIAMDHLVGWDSTIPEGLDMEYIKKWQLNDPDHPEQWKTRSFGSASSWHYFAYEQLDNAEKEYRKYFKVINDHAEIS